MTTKSRYGFLLLILTISIVACGGSAKPEDSAKALMDAVFAGRDITPLLCSAAQNEAPKIRETISRLADPNAKPDITGQTYYPSIDTSGLTYTVSDLNADTAKVKIGGNLKVTILGNTRDIPLTDILLPMKNENGWKVCEYSGSAQLAEKY